MKKIIKVVAIIASVILTLSFIACSNPSSSDGNSNNAEDPFAGTTWVLANQELSFKADMTVTLSGTKYNYSVEKENNKYIANILSPILNNQFGTFTLETKEAITGIMNPGSITFTKKKPLQTQIQKIQILNLHQLIQKIHLPVQHGKQILKIWE